MKFSNKRHRQAPTIIIISLIDILIVLLIFMMVTTSFKQQPAYKLVLPEAREAKLTPSQNSHSLEVTVAKEEPYFFLGRHPITSDRLEEEFKTTASRDPGVSLSLHADTGAPFGQVMKVSDAAKAAGIRQIQVFVKLLPKR